MGLQEPTMWKREAFLKLVVFSMVLSGFIGEGGSDKESHWYGICGIGFD
jgi:hypothetical protein